MRMVSYVVRPELKLYAPEVKMVFAWLFASLFLKGR